MHKLPNYFITISCTNHARTRQNIKLLPCTKLSAVEKQSAQNQLKQNNSKHKITKKPHKIAVPAFFVPK